MPGMDTVIVTGAGSGIGAAVVKAFLDRGYNIVANSLTFFGSELGPSATLALAHGDIGNPETTERAVETALSRFGTVDHVVNGAEFTQRGRSRITPTMIFDGSLPPIWKASSS